MAMTASNSISVKAFRFMLISPKTPGASRGLGVKGIPEFRWRNTPAEKKAISHQKGVSQLRSMDYASRGGGVAGGSVRQGAVPGSLGIMIWGRGGLTRDGLRASQKSNLVSTFNRLC